jgi:ferritin-like metal-binding protein YciE
MKLDTLQELYIHELQDLHSAEMQVKSALPKMIKGATDADLKEALQAHLEVTQTHVERLNEILKRHGAKREQEKCKGMEGVLAEGAAILEEEGDDLIRDLGIISACQRVEHYEMAGYGTARTFAERLNEEEDAEMLTETLEEESAADDELTSVATILLSQYEVEDSEEEEESENEGQEASASNSTPTRGYKATRSSR